MIDLTNFVNINIERLHRVSDTGSAPIVTLYKGDDSTLSTEFAKMYIGATSDYSAFYTEGSDSPIEVTDEELNSYLKIFFSNGGVAVNVLNEDLPTDTDGLKAIGQDSVIIAAMSKDTSAVTNLIGKNTSLGSLKGIYQKILVERIPLATTSENATTAVGKDGNGDFIAAKYSDVVGAEMSIAAYLSKMKCYSSVKDYDFTQEYNVEEDKASGMINKEQGVSLADIPCNFEMRVSNRYINIGGNTVSGESLVEQFATIVLTQTCTRAVFEALSSKVSGQKGLSALRTALCAELNRYVDSEFLVTDKIWEMPDLVVTNPLKEGDTETVITQYTPISSGYHIHTFALTSDQRSAYIFLILSTNKGIRYVQIDGKIPE